ncbi:hypothetical protein IP87_17865 [beta proteobacterium AAP121]|nr:hypothetical protein IP80_10815 [beta proteobacterium AAP65]KPF95003.1 hypothetical protein IP87_17865 [beta proteobacterium AAP121]
MVKFFVPAADDAAHAETLYEAVTKFNGLAPAGPRLHSLRFKHGGLAVHAEVGAPLPGAFGTEHQPVMAILADGERYRLCLPTRGGLWGQAILVPKDQVEEARAFD